jgi:hypothetical protein
VDLFANTAELCEHSTILVFDYGAFTRQKGSFLRRAAKAYRRFDHGVFLGFGFKNSFHLNFKRYPPFSEQHTVLR